MLISHRYKFIFIKSIKTASSTTELVFLPACLPPEMSNWRKGELLETEYGIVARNPRDQNDKDALFSHSSAVQLPAILPEEVWNGYFKFVNIRNPFTRAVSRFFYQRRVAGLEEITDLATARRALSSYLRNEYASYANHVMDRKGENLLVDDVIRFETLEEDIRRIHEKLGIEMPEMAIPHQKKSTEEIKKLPPAELLTQGAVDAILEKDGWLFENFGYSTRPEDA